MRKKTCSPKLYLDIRHLDLSEEYPRDSKKVRISQGKLAFNVHYSSFAVNALFSYRILYLFVCNNADMVSIVK